MKLLPCRSGGDPRDLIENGMHCCPNAKGEIRLVTASRRFSWPVFERLQRFSSAAPPQEAGGALVARTLPSRLSFSASFLIFCANRALLGRGVKGRAWSQLDFQPISPRRHSLLLREPEGNGVAQRFIRILKEKLALGANVQNHRGPARRTRRIHQAPQRNLARRTAWIQNAPRGSERSKPCHEL